MANKFFILAGERIIDEIFLPVFCILQSRRTEIDQYLGKIPEK